MPALIAVFGYSNCFNPVDFALFGLVPDRRQQQQPALR
jgi:hypothetical protein